MSCNYCNTACAHALDAVNSLSVCQFNFFIGNFRKGLIYTTMMAWPTKMMLQFLPLVSQNSGLQNQKSSQDQWSIIIMLVYIFTIPQPMIGKFHHQKFAYYPPDIKLSSIACNVIQQMLKVYLEQHDHCIAHDKCT